MTGIDISPVAIEQATRDAEEHGLANRVTFEVMDAESLDLEADSFGLVCGTGILHHLDLERAYGEPARFLRPDRSGIFVEPLGHNPVINHYRRRTPHLRTEDEHPLLMADLRRASRYFGEVTCRFFHLHTLLAVAARRWQRFEWLVDLLGRVDDAVFRLLPAIGRYAWVVAVVVAQPVERPMRRGARSPH